MHVMNINSDERWIKAAFARLDAVALGTSMGALAAILLSLATAYLLIKGAPPGQHIGVHLGLLAHFLPFYSVSWSGTLVGALEAFAIGFVIGVLLATAWNLTHYIWLMLIVRRAGQGQVL